MRELFATLMLVSAVGGEPRHEIARVHYDQVLIISKGDEVAAVCFNKIDDAEHVHYVYRLLSKDGKETKGKGQLVLKWKTRVENGKTIMSLDRDFTTIRVGRIGLLWRGTDRHQANFWYVPEEETVQLGDALYFEDIELDRFRKQAGPKEKE